MGFLICCDNKGCFETTEALLDPATDKVHCQECGGAINSVTSFTKVSMKTMGQTLKNKKQQAAFSVDCPACGKSGTPTVDVSDNVKCSRCKTSLMKSLSGPMIQAIRQNVSKSR